MFASGGVLRTQALSKLADIATISNDLLKDIKISQYLTRLLVVSPEKIVNFNHIKFNYREFKIKRDFYPYSFVFSAKKTGEPGVKHGPDNFY